MGEGEFILHITLIKIEGRVRLIIELFLYPLSDASNFQRLLIL